MPKRSSIFSRGDVSLKTRLVGDLTLDLPIISANMDTVTELDMATAMAELGGMGVIHGFIEDPRLHAEWVSRTPGHRFLTVGVKPTDLEKIPMVEDLHGLVIDVAHGHSDRVTETIAQVREAHPRLWIVAGNVATAEGAWDFLEAGAPAIKVGVGPGAVCTTRVVTGCGMPQLTAILKVRAAVDRWWDAERRKVRPRVQHPPTLIADGGIRGSGDMAKALVAGADTVMIGSLFAGTDEAPGAMIRENGKSFKLYRGMASAGAMEAVGADRTPEGISTLIPHKGRLSEYRAKKSIETVDSATPSTSTTAFRLLQRYAVVLNPRRSDGWAAPPRMLGRLSFFPYPKRLVGGSTAVHNAIDDTSVAKIHVEISVHDHYLS